MLRPVELDASGDPRPGESDERGLDDVLAVKEVIAVGLVEAHMNAAAEFGQDHEPRTYSFSMWIAFQKPVVRLGLNAIEYGQRIDAAAASLIDALLEEERIAICRMRHVGAERHRLTPCFDRTLFFRGSRRKLEPEWR